MNRYYEIFFLLFKLDKVSKDLEKICRSNIQWQIKRQIKILFPAKRIEIIQYKKPITYMEDLTMNRYYEVFFLLFKLDKVSKDLEKICLSNIQWQIKRQIKILFPAKRIEIIQSKNK